MTHGYAQARPASSIQENPMHKNLIIASSVIATLTAVSSLTLLAAPGQLEVCAKAQQKDTPDTASFGFLTPGNNGYLLYAGDFSPNNFAIDGRTQYYAQLDQALKSKGVQLIVSPLPSRTIVYPEVLDKNQPLQSTYSTDVARENYKKSFQRLTDLGLHTTDLLSTAIKQRQMDDSKNLYFARDYHWTSEGARLYAQAIAREVMKFEAYISLKKEKFTNTYIRSENTESRLAYLLQTVCGTKTPPEKINVFETTREGGNLLGDDAYPVVMIGSSYSAEAKYNFEGFLKEALSSNVLNVAVSGGGYNASLEAYLLSEAYSNEKPKFLIWEFAASMTPWEQTSLREIVPSVYGDCTSGTAILENKTSLQEGPTSVLKNTSANVDASKDFVSINFADKTLLNFDLNLKFNDGKAETVKITRSNRIPNQGQFYLKLSDEFKGDLSEVSVIPASKAKGAVTAKICRI
jgi:alginate biosynthesis protein AlgX